MSTRPRDGHQFRVLVIDDGYWGPEAVGPTLARSTIDFECRSHALAQRTNVTWAHYDAVLLDAYDDIGVKHNLEAPRLGALPVLYRLKDQPTAELPRVLVYSTEIERPEVAIPLREPAIASAFYTAEHAADPRVIVPAITDARAPQLVPEPTDDDWSALGLPRGAKIAAAHELIRRERPSVWSIVIDPTPHGLRSDADRQWIKRHIKPLLTVDLRWSALRFILHRVARG